MAYRILKQADDEEQELTGKFRIVKPAEKSSGEEVTHGIGQGGLDFLGLGALGLYPLEKGVQSILGMEEEPGTLLPGQEARFSGQHDILSKMQEGERPSFSDLMSLSDETDIAPETFARGTSLANIGQVQEKIPEGGYIQEGSRRVTRSLPWLLGGPGALGIALRGEAGGMAAKETAKALGAGEGVQTIADILGGFGGAAYKYKPRSSVTAPAVAEGTGLSAMIEKGASPQVIEKRLLSLGDDIQNEASKRMSNIAQERLSDFGDFSARETEELISKGNRREILNNINPEEKLPQKAWKDIGSAANDLYQSEKKAYSDIYSKVRDVSKNIEIDPKDLSSLNLAKGQLKKLTNIETTPAGYAQVESIVRSVIKDLTGKNISKEILENALVNGQAEKFENFLEGAFQGSKKVKADQLMDLSIRLGDVVNYETLIPGIKDLLKPIRESVKRDFRDTLQKQKPASLPAYNKAESMYKRTANRFGKDIINKLRTTETPELLSSDFTRPSNFENLKNIFGEANTNLTQAERQLVEQIGKQEQKVAQESFRNLEPYLSKNAKEAAKRSIDLGDKLTIPGQRRELSKNMLSDVSNSIGIGERPDYTLKAMRTPNGFNVAKDTFERTGQGKKLFNVLKKQVVEDLFNSITKDGQIDWKKAKDILSDPGYSQVMKEIMGEEGVQFLKNIERWSQNATANLVNLKHGSPTRFGKIFNALDTPAKLAMVAFFGHQFGILMGITAYSAATLLKRYGAQILSSETARNALRQFSLPKATVQDLTRSVEVLNEAAR